ncbi:MAG: glycine cleavage system protein GcvH [Bacteroidota bacterium]
MNFPDGLRYTKDHEWIKLDGDIGTIGITDYAQGELGDVVYLDLPAAGTKVEQSKSFGTIEAVKAVADLYAPVSGEIKEVNSKLSDQPELVNQQPYEGGWMVKIKTSDASQIKSLLDSTGYKQLIGQ